MTEEASLGGRPWRYAGYAWQITRPFVNATLTLAVILTVLMLWLVGAARTLVHDTLADVRFGLIKEIDQDSKSLIGDLRRGAIELDALRADIARISVDPTIAIDPETRRDIKLVRNDADRIARDLDRITSGHVDLSQKMMERLAVAVVRAFGDVRACEHSQVDETSSGPRTVTTPHR